MRKHFYLLTTLMAAVLLALPAVNTQAVRMLRQSAPTLKAAAEDNAVYIRV